MIGPRSLEHVLVGRCAVVDENGKFIVVQRTKSSSHNPGEWEFPGGKAKVDPKIAGEIERGELHSPSVFIQTAVRRAMAREFEEETGLRVEPANDLVLVENRRMQDKPGTRYVLFGAVAILQGGIEMVSDESDRIGRASYPDMVYGPNVTDQSRKMASMLCGWNLLPPNVVGRPA